MRISKIRIQNFRAFHDETISLGDYTCFIGPNGSGKSTILTALRVFFRDAEESPTDLINLQEEDFHKKNTKEPVVITVTFDQLQKEAQKDLADYYRQEELTVSAIAEWDPDKQVASVKQYGQRMGMTAFKEFFKAYGDRAKKDELKQLYETSRGKYPDLPKPGTKDAMKDALNEYESSHAEQCELIQSEDQFYGISRGADRLSPYIQWIYIPAVKDATTEQLEAKKTYIGLLLERTIRSKVSFDEPLKELKADAQEKYEKLIVDHKHVLEELSASLKRRLREWSHPDANLRLDWQCDSANAVKISEPLAQIIAGEGGFEGQLSRFGHGLQRSYLLALLQELAGCDDPNAPRLILACEEPELYQHPPQARYLFDVFLRLSKQNAQVVACTHSPYFVSGEEFENVRMFQKDQETGSARVFCLTFSELAEAVAFARGEKPAKPTGVMLKAQQALQPSLNEMFFSKVLILVEGLEDSAYITTYLNLMEMWDEYRRTGCHIVPTDGKSRLIKPLAIAKKLRIPTFVVVDSDAHKSDKNGSRKKHERDNIAILRLCNVTGAEPFPKDTLWDANIVLWKTEISNIVEDDIGVDVWRDIRNATRVKYDINVRDLNKNSLFITYALKEAWDQGKNSANLEKLCRTIIDYGTSQAGPL